MMKVVVCFFLCSFRVNSLRINDYLVDDNQPQNLEASSNNGLPKFTKAEIWFSKDNFDNSNPQCLHEFGEALSEQLENSKTHLSTNGVSYMYYEANRLNSPEKTGMAVFSLQAEEGKPTSLDKLATAGHLHQTMSRGLDYVKSWRSQCSKTNHGPGKTLLMLRDAYQGTEVEWGNPWHNIAAVYPMWVSINHLHKSRDNITILLPPGHGETTTMEHLKVLSKESPKGNVDDWCSFSEIVVPLGDGFMWDLAWNQDFACVPGEGKLMATFANSFMESLDVPVKPSNMAATNSVQVCLMHRSPAHVRQLKNEGDVLESLGKCKRGDQFLSVSVLDFEKEAGLSVREQVERTHQCDVVVGVHGAGLTHLLWLPKDSAVVEILPKHASQTEMYFHNLAMLTGATYRSTTGSIDEHSVEADLSGVQKAVLEAVQEIGWKQNRFAEASCNVPELIKSLSKV